MNNVVVPLELDKSLVKQDNMDIQTESFFLNREQLINSLRHIGGIINVAKSLKSDEIYKFVLSPENATLYKDTEGNLKGVFYKDGKIVEHAKLKAVRPDIAKVASTIGTQILLLDIAVQLRQIEKTLTTMRKEMNNDRIAEIKSGIEQFQAAKKIINNPNIRDGMITNAIQSLNTGLAKVKQALEIQIKELPDASNGFLDNWGKKKSVVAKEKFAIAEVSLRAYQEGMEILAEIYATINEPELAKDTLLKCIRDLRDCNIESAIPKTRLLPYKDGGKDCEAKWINIEKITREIPLQLNTINDYSEFIVIELKPRELLEINYDKAM